MTRTRTLTLILILLAPLALAQQSRIVGPTKLAGTTRMGSNSPLPQLAFITVTPTAVIIPVGSTSAFIATGTFTDNTVQDLTGSAAWLSSNLTVASIISTPSTFQCNISGVVTISAIFLGITGTAQLTCAGVPPPPLNITTTSLPNGQIGQPYPPNVKVATANGVAPVFFTLSTGALPAGLGNIAIDGTISGTPVGPAGTTIFTVHAQDSSVPPQQDDQVLSIQVVPSSNSLLAELPRQYADPVCAAPSVIKTVCASGDVQCPGGPGDYPATNAGIKSCLADGVAAASNWACRVTPRANLGGFQLPNRPAANTNCISIKSFAPIGPLPFSPLLMQTYAEGSGNVADNSKRWIAEASGGNEGIGTAVPSGGNVPHHYVISDAEVIVKSGVTSAFALLQLGRNDATQPNAASIPHHIFASNLWVHGSADQSVQHAINLNGNYISITDSVCTDVHQSGVETHCIAGDNGTGVYTLQNLYLGAGSVNSIMGGSAGVIPGIMTCDVLFAGVYSTRPLDWQGNGFAWVNKNRFEIKRGCRVLVRASILENSWVDGQTGGCVLNQVRQTQKEQTIHDITYQDVIVRHCSEFFDGILGSGGGLTGSGDGPSQSASFITLQNILAYDISTSRMGTGTGRGLPFGNATGTFGTQAGTITSQVRDAAGITTVTLAASPVPADIRVGLPAVIAGSSGGFDTPLAPVTSVITSTSFTYQGPVGVPASSSGGTATFACLATSDAFHNVVYSCPDTKCGTRSPCAGGLEIGPTEWVNTLACANPLFNTSQNPAQPDQNPFSLSVNVLVPAAPVSSTTTCSLLNHQGSPYNVYVNHVSIFGRDKSMLMITNLGGNTPIMRRATIKNSLIATENAASPGFSSSGLADGTASQATFDTGTFDFHHILLGKKTANAYTEYRNGVGVSPPTTIFTPANLACAGLPDGNCLGLFGNYTHPNPDAGAPITGYAATAATATVTTKYAHGFTVGETIQQQFLDITFPLLGPLTTLLANNTSNCGPVGFPSASCTSLFPQQLTNPANTNALQQIIEPLPGHISYRDTAADYMYTGFNGLVWCQAQVWWKYGQFGHINIGEDMSTTGQVAARLANMQRMGCDVVWVDWYSRDIDSAFNDNTTLEISRQLGQGIPANMFLVVMYDQGSLKVACPPGGGEQSACIIAKMKTDWDYLNLTYFAKPYYLRGNLGDNRPMLPFFVTESNYPATNWTNVWNTMRTWSNAYTFTAPTANGLNFIYRFGDFNHIQSDGEFAWVVAPAFNNVPGNTSELCWNDIVGDTGTPCNPVTGVGSGTNYLGTFYGNGTGCASAAGADKYCIGGLWFKFDWSNSGYTGGVQKRVFSQYGQVGILSGAEAQRKGYSTSNQLYAVGLDTLNDFGEGTGVENGVDSGWTVTASRNGGILSWTGAKANATYVVPSTIVQTEIVFSDHTTGVTFQYSLANGFDPVTGSIDLSSIPSGTWDVRVHLIGRAWIQDVYSNPVAYVSTGTLAAENGAKVVTAVTTVAPFTYSYATPTVITNITGNPLGTSSTGTDYHQFGICAATGGPFVACPGASAWRTAADDGTMLGADTVTIDAAFANPSHPPPH